MRYLLLSVILLLTLATPATAHPGDTNSYGGHYDRSTGEYHYHHGYEAHEHYDVDDDGDMDCPYDFDDQTGRNSGSPTASASTTRASVSTDSIDYRRGYEDGHDDGYDEGKKYVNITADSRYEEGLETGRVAGYADGYNAGYSKARTLAFWAAGLIGLFFLLISRHRKKCREAEERESEARYERALEELRAEVVAMRTKAEQIKTEHEFKLKQLNYNHELDLQKVVGRTELLTRLHANDPRAKEQLGIPLDVHFNGSDIYIGTPSVDYPYGELTVFTSYSGTRYHFECGCSGSYTPNLIYDVIEQNEPCKRCAAGRITPTYVPGWYTEHKRLCMNQRRIEINRPFPPQSPPALTQKNVKASPARPYGAVPITLSELEELALKMGVDLRTALKIRNMELRHVGKPPVYYDGEL